MRVTLVNPPSPGSTHISRGLMGGFGMAVGKSLLYPPIELAHIAAVLREARHKVHIFDCDADGLTTEDLLARLRIEKPRAIGVDTSTASWTTDLALAKALAGRGDAHIFSLGSHVTHAPEEVFSDTPVEAIVRGEPEHTVRDLVDAWAKDRSLAEVPGLHYRADDGSMCMTEERPLIKDLDGLPLPARDLLANDRYHFPDMRGPVTTVKSSRGCPLDCAFCGYVLIQGRRFRYRSPDNVVAELKDIHGRGIPNVVFRDPIFTVGKPRVLAIMEGIQHEGIRIRWQCETALRYLNFDVIDAMAAAGCVHISFGVETGNAELMEKYAANKLPESGVEAARAVVKRCRSRGIDTRGFCMIGFPEETPAMTAETVDLITRLNPDTVQFTAVTPYPGTPLFNQVEGREDLQMKDLSGYLPMAGNEHMDAEEIKSQIKKAYRRFYVRPGKMLGELRHPLRLVQKAFRYRSLFDATSA